MSNKTLEWNRRVAAKSLHTLLTKNGHPKWLTGGIGTPDGSDERVIYAYVRTKRDLKNLPAEHDGFVVKGVVMGELRMN